MAKRFHARTRANKSPLPCCALANAICVRWWCSWWRWSTEVWSNDRYVAPVHRVKAQRSLERYSAPFFYNPSYETNYAPVSGTISDETPAKYRPINWGEFRLGRFQGDFADVGAEVQISDFLLHQ